MESYLSKIVSSIPASQREAVRKILNEEMGVGEVLDLERLITEANRLGLTLDGNNPRPLLASQPRTRLFTSRQLNQFLRFARQDVLTTFNEVDNISFVVESLDRLNVADAKKLDKQIRSLEDQLTLQEILLDEPMGLYLNSIFSTFSSSEDYSLNVLRDRPALYSDPRTSSSFSTGEVLSIDIDREGLNLPVQLNNSLNIFNVNVSHGFNTTATDYNLSDAKSFTLSSTPSNSLDSLRYKDSKIWCNLLYLQKNSDRTSAPTSASTELVFNLGGPVDINNIKISPMAGFPLDITSISYLSLDNTLRVISDSTFTVSDDISFSFSRITAQKIFIKLTQTNHFYYEGMLRDLEYSDIYSALPSNLLKIEEASDLYALSNLSALPNKVERALGGWIFPIALDQVQFDLSKFKEKGLYLSKEVEVDMPAGKVLLDATYQLSTDDAGNPQDAIEYYVNKYDYSKTGSLVQSAVYPIMPIVDSSVAHEALVLNSAGITNLRFYPDLTSTVRIYKNFVQMTEGYTLTSLSETPYRYQVQINTRDPLSVYTASYTPLAEEIDSDNPLYMDREGIGVMQSENSINFIYPSYIKDKVVKSKIILSIIFRSLTHDQSFRGSPILFDYTLHVG